MRLSPERRAHLQARSLILQGIRHFFQRGGFCEVETPHRIPAPLPEFTIDLFDSEGWFLHPSPESCMKRLLADGFDRIFQISRCWRKGERGSMHLPEFTLLEWYRTDADYLSLMTDCVDLFRWLAESIEPCSGIRWRGTGVDLSTPWERVTVRDAFLRYGGIAMEEAIASDRFDEIMVEAIEPNLGVGRPTFLVDYPVERGSLARRRDDDPRVVQRFELYLAGLELANGFSELTDPDEQRLRFQEEESLRRREGKPPYPPPARFLDDLTRIPSAAGIALGVDRLVMLLTGADTIDEVVSFTPEEL